jgi:quinol monooxygenase YgiN
MKSSPPRAGELVQALRSLIRQARAEKGFITCRLCLEADSADTIYYEERWATQKDFEEQARLPRYFQLLALMESATEPPSLEFHFVSETRGLEYLARLRGKK